MHYVRVRVLTFFGAVAKPQCDQPKSVLKNVRYRLARTQHNGTYESCVTSIAMD